MGVQLNIKSAEARELAEQIADATGASLTDAVVTALRQRARELDIGTRRDRIDALLKGSRDLWKPELLESDYNDWLYDEDGMPK